MIIFICNLQEMATIKPILRIFDYDKAKAFYIDWLGFKIDWEHRHDHDSPLYLQVSLDDIVLHLSEHHGDGSPGVRVFIDDFTGLRKFHQLLNDKHYRYNRPGINIPFYDANALEMQVIDPSGNRLIFVEKCCIIVGSFIIPVFHETYYLLFYFPANFHNRSSVPDQSFWKRSAYRKICPSSRH